MVQGKLEDYDEKMEKFKMPLIERLANIDWDFKDSNTDPIHSLHPYPAKFTSHIPKSLIEQLGVPKDTIVMDPFCGSGTTLVEAQRLGFTAIGVDSNPIACLISRVKTKPLPEKFLEVADICVFNAKAMNNMECSIIPNVNHWFKSDIQEVLSKLMSQIVNVDDQVIEDGLRLALSSIIVRVSNQESDTRYAAIEKKVEANDVYELFMKACKKIMKAKEDNLIYEKKPVTVIEHDILTLAKEDIGKPVGLVITSPPYPNAYEYWLYHKYRMWWLGYDPIDVKNKEIGARAHFFKKNHHTEEDFKNQMDKTISLINNVLVPGGFICFVIGRSIIHGKVIDNAAIIEEIADNFKLKTIIKKDRVMQASRKSFNLSHANIKKETILVFQK